MTLKHLFIINAIVALAYAFGELIIPKTLLSLYFSINTPSADIASAISPLRFTAGLTAERNISVVPKVKGTFILYSRKDFAEGMGSWI